MSRGGTLSAMLRRGVGPRPRTNGSHKGPLRRVVSERFDGYLHGRFEVPLEMLECGHEQRGVCDLMGPTHAARRRCWRCKDASVAGAAADGRSNT